MFKRIGLFLVVNILVVVTVSLVLNIFQVAPYLTKQGINYSSLLAFCAIWGMAGSLISLALSRIMAKRMMGVRVIVPHEARENYEVKLLAMVHTISRKAGLTTMPEVGIYDSPELNAFATGPTKNRSLVAVSSGLLNVLDEKQVEGVIAHEVAHIANGDMVTMTLLQGVVNAFVMFFARIAASVVSGAMNRNSDNNRPGAMHFILVWVFEMILMVLGSIVVSWFSRYREYRADAGGAKLSSKASMISALRALGQASQIKNEEEPESIAAFKINGGKSRLALLFSTHPPLEDRIKALENS